MTYGFEDFKEITVKNPMANYLKIQIIQEIDVEGMPRSKKVLFTKKKAFYYESKGKINTSLSGLDKVVF